MKNSAYCKSRVVLVAIFVLQIIFCSSIKASLPLLNPVRAVFFQLIFPTARSFATTFYGVDNISKKYVINLFIHGMGDFLKKSLESHVQNEAKKSHRKFRKSLSYSSYSL